MPRRPASSTRSAERLSQMRALRDAICGRDMPPVRAATRRSAEIESLESGSGHSPVERPISFNDEMIAALLSGRKTQTRRLIGARAATTCKHGCRGDRLWVRQRWSEMSDTDAMRIVHSASHETRDGDPSIRWRPSYLMPRRACTTLLQIIDVRAERLCAISEPDAAAEGFDAAAGEFLTAKMWFADLWNRINRAEGTRWQDDPWVWAISFGLL